MSLSIRRREHIAFSPLAVPGGLEAWYAPYRGGVIADSSFQVTGLSDLSGRGRHIGISDPTTAPLLATENNQGNLCIYSEDLTQSLAGSSTVWAASSVTVNASDKFTFTAQNGNLTNNVRAVVPNATYTLRFKAKAVSGHTSLTLLSAGATVASQAITLTGTLDQYEYTFTMGASANGVLAWGLKDTAASGFGQVQLTNCQLLETTWDKTYLATSKGTRKPLLGSRPYLMLGRGLQPNALTAGAMQASFTLPQPYTLYFLARPVVGGTVGVYFCDGVGANNQGAVLIAANGTTLQITAGSVVGTKTVTPGTWQVISVTFNGASSSVQINRATPETINAGTTAASGFTLGARQAGDRQISADLMEVIIRSGADDAAQRNAFQLYLANVAGIVI